MAETGNTKATVSKFERMSVEELEEAIRIYFEADDLDENMENLLLASEVLDRKKEAMGDLVDTDAQWARFQRDYLPLLNDADIEEGDAEGTATPGAQTTETGSKPRRRKPIVLRAFHAVAAAVLIFMLLGLTACAVIPQVRTAVVNFVMNTFGNHSVVSVDTGANEAKDNTTDETEDLKTMEIYELNGYSFSIPAEFELDSISENTKRSVCGFIDDDSSLFIFVGASNFSPIQLDTEETESKTIYINGKEGFVIEKGSKKYVAWGDPESDRIIYILGENVNEEILLNIARTFIPLED